MGVKKAAGKGTESSAVTCGKEQFWSTLDDEDAKIAKAWDISSREELEKRKEKQKAAQQKAQNNQARDIRQNESRAWYEKEQEKKQREKEREDRKWQADLERARQRALKEHVVECVYDANSGKCWAELGGGNWKEVAGEYYCKLCEKCPNGAALEAHLNSEAHKKKLAWATGAAYTPALPAPAPAAASMAIVPMPATCIPVPQDLPAWQQMGPDGLVRCLPCGKVVDDNHLMTGDHTRRLASWLEQEKLKTTGYTPPDLEYLAWAPCDENDPQSERWMKCLLCSKWVQDETSHSGTPAQPAGSKEHQKNLRNYGWYRENVLQQRQKYHPKAAAQPKQPAKAPAKAPPPPPPTPQQQAPPPVSKAPPPVSKAAAAQKAPAASLQTKTPPPKPKAAAPVPVPVIPSEAVPIEEEDLEEC